MRRGEMQTREIVRWTPPGRTRGIYAEFRYQQRGGLIFLLVGAEGGVFVPPSTVERLTNEEQEELDVFTDEK